MNLTLFMLKNKKGSDFPPVGDPYILQSSLLFPPSIMTNRITIIHRFYVQAVVRKGFCMLEYYNLYF